MSDGLFSAGATSVALDAVAQHRVDEARRKMTATALGKDNKPK